MKGATSPGLRRDFYTVFALFNHRRREIYVGATTAPMFELIERLRKRRPAALAHWDLDDVKEVRSLEFDLDRTRASVYVASFARNAPPPDWRYCRERSPHIPASSTRLTPLTISPWIPADFARTVRVHVVTEAMEPKRAPRPHIAVVDDSDDVGLLVRLLLSPDYAATAFTTGEELLARLAKLKPDLVILDVSLTGACGLEIAQRIRERAGFEDLPILFLTGLRREELGEALERHRTAFLRKPFDRKALLDGVQSLIGDDAALPAFSS